MKKTFVLFLCWFLIGSWAFAQKKAMSYYLPDGNYNPAIPTPESVLGFQIGEWHISHDKLVMYMQALANASDRITLTQYGRSYERRPLLYLTITAPQNQSRIKEIQQQHLSLSDPQVSAKLNTADMPAITYHGYCVHGNESSGANAALLFAYHLAAAQGPAIEKTLKEVIVLLDPCYNPDGFNRFASWVNVHKSKNLSADPANREFNEPFPGGRTNHYWFDLNRDWLPAQHPESQGRVKNFHEWKPLILTDHHEMGTDNTFFFQPGIATRTNPLTPDKNQELTYKIGTYHAKALDNIGSLYYAQESFDDFYYGKGSTYPDVNGSIGILFEQASSRGHLQESRHGILSFPFTIRNQLQTSLSTLAAAEDMRVELLDYHREFYRTAMEQAKKDNKKGYIFGTNKANNRVQELLTILQRHQIQVNKLEKDTRVSGQAFDKDHAYIVSLNQPQYRLIKAMFEKVTTFKDSLFYDVSAWTLPLAFNIPYAALNAADLKGGLMGKDLGQVKQKLTMAAPAKSDYAYLFEWDDYLAPNALNQLLKAGLMVKVANNSFTSVNEGQKVSYPPGTLMVPVQNNQTKTPEDIHTLVSKASTSTGIRFVPAATGFTPQGVDLGSPSFSMLKKPEVLLLVGNGVTSYDAGEVWHLLDQRYDMAITMMESDEFDNNAINRYNTIVLVNGFYNDIGDLNRLKSWIRQGGTLIVMRNAVSWAKSKGLANVNYKRAKKKNKTKKSRPYNQLSADRGAQFIGGAIFETQLDLTHPLCYGYQQNRLPVFRRGTLFLEKGNTPYSTPVRYTANPLLSGYIADANLQLLKSSATVIVTGMGSGKVIAMTDNPNFRAFWYGTNRLFANAIFFGHTINGRSTESAPPPMKDKKE